MTNKKELLLSIGFFFAITVLFFYKIFLRGYIPFPGDLLTAEYNPWRTYSYLGYIPGTIPNKAQYFDTLRQLYPWKSFSIEMLKNGEIPLWNPHNFSGHPLLANHQSAIFYPLNILYLLLPQVLAWSILIILQPYLASFFTYLLARQLKMSKMGAAFAAVAYGFSLFMTVFLEYNTIGHVILWLPLILLAIEKLTAKLSARWIFIYIASLVFSFFAGHIQIFGFLFIFVFIYGMFRSGKKSLHLLIINALALGITAIQLLPTLELIKHSARIPQEYNFLIENLLLQLSQLILFIYPDFFGNPVSRNYQLSDSYPGNAVHIGLFPIAFAIFAIFRYKNSKFTKFFAYSSLAILILILRTPLTELLYKFNIPFFSTGSPSNTIFLLSFSLSILAGFGMEQFFRKKRLLPYFVILLTLINLFFFFQKFNPFVQKELIYPSAKVANFLSENAGINRFWGYGSAAIEANYATQLNLFSPDGYDPLYPKRYGEFIGSSKDGKLVDEFSLQTRSDANVAPGYGEQDLTQNEYRLKILDVLGVKYILDRVENSSTEKTFPPERFEKTYEQDGWIVFENLEALPRAFLVYDYEVFQDKEGYADRFFSEEFNPRRTVLLEKEPTLEIREFGDVGDVGVTSYEPNMIKLEIETDQNGLLFLSDTHYPGWKAYIDGKETKLLRANYAFRAIPVAAGKHTVKFSYQPGSFKWGAGISMLSLALVLPISLLLKRNE